MESNDKLEQMLQQMYDQESLHDEDIDTSEIIDEEWVKFEAEHFSENGELEKLGNGSSFNSSIFQSFNSFKKVAAMFIGVLMLSGITYAAIRIVSQHVGGDLQSPTQEARITNSRQQITDEQPADSTAMKPVVFEDAELTTILHEVATFYQCETVYKNEKVKHVRLYFTWDKTKPIDEVVETFNKFERFHITRENQKLIVE